MRQRQGGFRIGFVGTTFLVAARAMEIFRGVSRERCGANVFAFSLHFATSDLLAKLSE